MSDQTEFLKEVDRAVEAFRDYVRMIRNEARRQEYLVRAEETEAEMFDRIGGIKKLNEEMDWVEAASSHYKKDELVEFYNLVRDNLPLKRVIH